MSASFSSLGMRNEAKRVAVGQASMSTIVCNPPVYSERQLYCLKYGDLILFGICDIA